VFLTPGWAIILGGSFTLGGVIVTQVFTIWSKSADRRQERKLAYEARVAEAKHAAIKRLITACRSVKSRPAESSDANFRRGATIRGLDLFREKIGGEDGIGEVVSYAEKSVCTELEKMLDKVDAEHDKHEDRLSEIGRIGTDLYAVSRQLSSAQLAEAEGLRSQRDALYRQREQAFVDLGAESDLDVDTVFRMCDGLIDIAKQDLQGDVTVSGVSGRTIAALVVLVVCAVALDVGVWAHGHPLADRVVHNAANVLLVVVVLGLVFVGVRWLSATLCRSRSTRAYSSQSKSAVTACSPRSASSSQPSHQPREDRV
jgi:hypothetical protein